MGALSGIERACGRGNVNSIDVTWPAAAVSFVHPSPQGQWTVAFVITMRNLPYSFQVQRLSPLRHQLASTLHVDDFGGRVEIARFAVGVDHVALTTCTVRGL